MLKKKSKQNTATGLDVSDRSIEIVQLDQKGKNIKVRAYARVELPFGAVEKGEVVDQFAFDSAFNDLLDITEQQDFTFENLVISLPDEFIEHKLVEIEPQEGKDLAVQIFDKIKGDLHNTSLEWQYEIIEVEVGEKVKYIFSGISSQKLRDFVKGISEFGLLIDIVESDASALVRHIDSSEIPQFVIDFGANKTILYLVSGGVVYDKLILDFGGDKLIGKLSKVSKLNKEKEEKFFKRVGYGSRTEEDQKKIIEEEFKSFNKSVLKFVKKIKEEFGVEVEQGMIAGGLSNMVGITKLLPEEMKFAKLAPLVNINSDQSDFLVAVGCAIRGIYPDYYAEETNYLKDEMKEIISTEVQEELVKKQEMIIHKQIDPSERSDKSLKSAFSEKWGYAMEKPKKWKLSLRLTMASQILFILIAGVAGIFYLVNYLNSERLVELDIENKAIDEQRQREYITFNFPLVVSTGENVGNTDTASILGSFQKVTIETKDVFVAEGGVLTQEDLDNAHETLARRIRSGDIVGDTIKLAEGEYLVPESVSYEEILAAADKEIDNPVETFEYTIKAEVTFAKIEQERIDLIIGQRLSSQLRDSEDMADYTSEAVRFLLIEYFEKEKIAKFSVNIESER